MYKYITNISEYEFEKRLNKLSKKGWKLHSFIPLFNGASVSAVLYKDNL